MYCYVSLSVFCGVVVELQTRCIYVWPGVECYSGASRSTGRERTRGGGGGGSFPIGATMPM